MKKNMIIMVIIQLLYAQLLIADTIYLKDGLRLEVEITNVSEDNVQFYRLGSLHSIPLDSVKRIERIQKAGNEQKLEIIEPEEKSPKKNIQNADMVNVIILKSGKLIVAKKIWIEPDEVQYEKYGAILSVKKEDYIEIKQMPESDAANFKYSKSDFQNDADNKDSNKSPLDRIAKESKLRSIQATGHAALFVRVGMTEDEVIEIAGAPEKIRHSSYFKTPNSDAIACNEIFDEYWTYKYHKKYGYTEGTNWMTGWCHIFYREGKVVCPAFKW